MPIWAQRGFTPASPRGLPDWVKVHIPDNNYFNFYNAPTEQARTCVKVEQHHLDFQISSIRINRPWGYPNVSSGWESDINSCSGVKGACLKYPVREKNDGTPVTSAATCLNTGVYNAAYDTAGHDRRHPVGRHDVDGV